VALLPMALFIAPVRLLLEGDMAVHMLVEFPLLLAAGASASRWVPDSLARIAKLCDWKGISTLLAFILVSAFWMIPAALDAALLDAAPHPWLVIEDAHHNVAAVLAQFHAFLRKGDYLYVEDSEIKRDDIRQFLAERGGCYLVDTGFTDFFGRNATCALDSIFLRASD